MFIINKKSSFYIGNCIALIILFLLSAMFTVTFYLIDGYEISTYIYIFVSIMLFMIDIYYAINTIYDNKIRQKGTCKTAKIVNVFDRRFRFSAINTIIVFEYFDDDGHIIRTKETVNNLKHIFKKGESIKVLFNGKKALLNRSEYA